MPQDYKYDVFISYLRTDPNGEEAATSIWVREYLHQELKLWLPGTMPPGYKTQVFLDDISIRTGTEWPLALQQALQTSRCLLAVLSSQYFGSQWCLAELETMRAREKLLGLRTEDNPSGLIYAVAFSGHKFFPDTIRTIQQKDLSEFAYTHSKFKDSPKYESFQDAIKKVCQDLGEMLENASTWQNNWPVVLPEQPLRAVVQLPRL